MPELLTLADPVHPPADLIEACLDRLRCGEVLAGPTDTTYGLFCDPFRPDALKRIASLKARPEGKPIPLLVADRQQAAHLATDVPSLAAHLMEAFWPGGLTIVVPSSPIVPGPVTQGTGAVGLRQPDCAYLLHIMEALGGPITGTSANRSGEAPSATAAEVLAALGEEVDAVIYGWTADRREGSTVIAVTDEGISVLREGVVAVEAITEVTGALPGS